MKRKSEKYYFGAVANDCEMRAATESDSGGKRIITGYAVRFDQQTTLFKIDDVEYKEEIDQGAFNGCDLTDTVFDRGHAMEDKVLARTKNGTLQLSVDSLGLKFTAEIADTQEGRDTYELIRRGDIQGCSFAAVIAEASYDKEKHLRRILRFERLLDVAAVTFPAYDDTPISAEMRSAFGIGGTEAAERELQFKKMQLLMQC